MSRVRPRVLAGIAAVVLGAFTPNAAVAQAGRARVLIVSGVSGEAALGDAFFKQATSMMDALKTRFGVPDSDVVYLAETPTRDAARIKGASTKENIERELAALGARSKAGDVLFVMLIGHGAGDDAAPKFNVPGPDIAAADFARVLDEVHGPIVAIVNAASASGGFITQLSGPNRVVATATKSGMERNQTRFASYFVQAYSADVADADKDGRVSVLEAFDYARREVARAYEGENHMLTEHAQLDDNGDRKGTAAPDAKSPDGGLARRTFLGGTAGSVASVARAASNDPRVASLEREKDSIETRLDALRRQKATMDSTAYQKSLETLLVQLAQKNKAIRDAAGGRP
ncbi:MAG TPA: C13 family peptidase [Gemmatimonadaceae bacterium]|nr:C13 family peptidase [Gemmatimonadaceae bacterium]